ncbi:MAG: HD domain-containing protein [Chloroflexi bacterium]|nr:HD domain-containing protein [Chloroflexota bacterium]MBU1750106.1 HD domain-containing protein [Chloroflexota bacterium]MBU1880314.1 HD domain-containing protein [Chloroflexota bacterium]
MADPEARLQLRRVMLLHWFVIPAFYMLLRLSGVGPLLGLDVLLLGALLGLLWFTLLTYARWGSPTLIHGLLVTLDLFLITLVLLLAGGLSNQFYILYGLVLILAGIQLTGAWMLAVTLVVTGLAGGLLLWPASQPALELGSGVTRIALLMLVGVAAWLYGRRRRPIKQRETEANTQLLSWFHQITDNVDSQTDAVELSKFAAVMVRRLCNADVGTVVLLDRQQESEAHLYNSIGNEAVRQSVLHLDIGGDGLCDRLIRDGYPLTACGVGLDVGTPSLLTYYPPVHSFVGVPFKSGANSFGALLAANQHSGQPFTPEDQIVVAFLGSQVSMALENRRLVREVRERFTNTIEALVAAIEAKHPYTRGHSDQVIRYAVAMAKELRLTESEIENIRVAAVLHDVGKIGVPEGILDKAGALTDRERSFIMSHPYTGAKIVEAVDPKGEILYMVYYHHENYDGSGYPKGLRGDQIPLGASIIRVADAFEAMTSNRPYQPSRTAAEALRELRAGAGRQFDPVVVRAFGRALRQLAQEQAR